MPLQTPPVKSATVVLDTLRSLRLPDLTRLGDAELQQLDDAYERLRAEILQPLPKMADDSVRAQIDDAVSQTLGFDAGWIRTVRRELAREPSVTDKPYGL